MLNQSLAGGFKRESVVVADKGGRLSFIEGRLLVPFPLHVLGYLSQGSWD